MTLEYLALEKKTVKNHVINILGEQWPLTILQLRSMLKSRHNLSVSYQAVHLVVRDFLEKGVLMKNSKAYMLNPAWVEQTHDFVEQLYERYIINHAITLPKKVRELTFHSIHEAFDFVLAKSDGSLVGNSHDCYVQLGRLFVLPLSQQRIDAFQSFCSSHNVVILVRSNTAIDKLAGAFLRKLGAKVHLGISCALPTNTIIFGDSVISIYVLYSKSELATVRSIYRTKKNILDEPFFKSIISFFKKPIRVKLVINRDPAVVDDVKRHTVILVPQS